jgi:hypothetical protein
MHEAFGPLDRLHISSHLKPVFRSIDPQTPIFNLKTLNAHVQKSGRALNDRRMLRRLIVNERFTVENVISTL